MRTKIIVGGAAALAGIGLTAPAMATNGGGDRHACPSESDFEYKVDNVNADTFLVPGVGAGWTVIGVSVKAGDGNDSEFFVSTSSGEVIGPFDHQISHVHICKREDSPSTTTTTAPPSTTTTAPATTTTTTTVPATTTTVSGATTTVVSTTTVPTSTPTTVLPTTTSPATTPTSPPTSSTPTSSVPSPTSSVPPSSPPSTRPSPSSTRPAPPTSTSRPPVPSVPSGPTSTAGPRLADTGSDSGTLIPLAAASVALGIALVAMTLIRRRS